MAGAAVRLLGLPDALRRYGLEPIECTGWQTSGPDLYGLLGSLDHHTAGARTGYMPSLGVLLNGRSDLPPRLANVGSPRSEAGDFRVYVLAAGRANHAGAGFLPAYPEANSNYELGGLERELVGDGSDLTPHRHDVACRVHAAFADLGSWPRDVANVQRVARHATYAPSRKIDTRGVTDQAIRDRVVMLRSGTTVPTPPEVLDMEAEYVALLHRTYLGAPDSMAAWDKGMVGSFDWHLWRLQTGAVTKEGMRSQFRDTAVANGRM